MSQSSVNNNKQYDLHLYARLFDVAGHHILNKES